MTRAFPAPPEHPQLDDVRVAELTRHLAEELRRERVDPRGRRGLPRLAPAFGAALLAVTLVGAGYALGNGAFDAFDFRGGPSDPKRIGERVQIAAADEWSLQAWSSTRGICIGVGLDGAPAFSGCGMPVAGAPPDQVFEQPQQDHAVGYLAGGEGRRLYVAGPVAENVARVEVELIEGQIVEAPVYEAPPELDVDVDFYFVRANRASEVPSDRHPVKSLRAYDAAGALLERLDVPRP